MSGRLAMRRVLLIVLLAAGACYSDRARPLPSEAEGTASLSVRLLDPPNGLAVLGDHTITVAVEGRDLGGDLLVGVGFVARRVGNGPTTTLDSIALRSGPGRLIQQEFVFLVPDLATNTQVDVVGIAYGPGTQTRLSDPSSLIVIRCGPGIPGC